MAEPLIRVADEPEGVRRLTLARPATHNAFDDVLIAELTHVLEVAATADAVRAIVLTGDGKSFSAGADIAWMRRAADLDETGNLADARALAKLMATLDRLPKPTIAMVNGAAIGGGLGLVAAADIAIASEVAVFAATEVRLGIVPAVISPLVVRAIGARQARRLFLTGERIDASRALAIGLVHEVVAPAALEERTRWIADEILKGAPAALAQAKSVVDEVRNRDVDDATFDDMARLIAKVRVGAEAREGLGAFLDKRRPEWL